jgi:hypothetical protein
MVTDVSEEHTASIFRASHGVTVQKTKVSIVGVNSYVPSQHRDNIKPLIEAGGSETSRNKPTWT